MSVPSVTVLLCTRDRPEQIHRCLESILQLSRLPAELIVVDNASRSFSVPQLNYRIPTRFFSYPVPGLSRARNSVLPQVRGEILALIDDDAVAAPEWLDAAMPHFQDPDVGCVTGKILPLEVNTSWQEKQAGEQGDRVEFFDRERFDPITSSPGKGANVLIRKSCLGKAGFPELFGPGTPVCAGDEHYLFYQVISAGWKICYEPAAVVFHDYSETEEEFLQRAKRRAISRGAFLAKFLLTENGYRLHTGKYLLGRLLGKPGGKSDIPAGIRNIGFFLGPVALIQSALRNAPAHRSVSSTLLAEFDATGSA